MLLFVFFAEFIAAVLVAVVAAIVIASFIAAVVVVVVVAIIPIVVIVDVIAAVAVAVVAAFFVAQAGRRHPSWLVVHSGLRRTFRRNDVAAKHRRQTPALSSPRRTG